MQIKIRICILKTKAVYGDNHLLLFPLTLNRMVAGITHVKRTVEYHKLK